MVTDTLQGYERGGGVEPYEKNVAQSSFDIRDQGTTTTLGVPVLGDSFHKNRRRPKLESGHADTFFEQK